MTRVTTSKKDTQVKGGSSYNVHVGENRKYRSTIDQSKSCVSFLEVV